MRKTSTYTTGSRYGYVRQANRGVESEIRPIPEVLKKEAGQGGLNRLWALQRLQASGATHYTTSELQGTNGYYSNQYCRTRYIGYVAETV